METDTQQLIEDYLEGEPGAVAQIDDWIRASARSYHRRLASQWEDVLQDVRLEVFEALGRGEFRGEARLRTYVWRVVSHTCLDRVRATVRWRWTDVEESPEAQELGDLRRGRRNLPLETVDLLSRVLEQVPQDCRRLWRMIVEGRSYREMSERTGVSTGALRVRVLRCRRKAMEVRERLEAEREA